MDNVLNINSLMNSKMEEYLSLRNQQNLIKKRMAELSAELKDYAESVGSKSETGSFYTENDRFILGKQAKKSVTFDKEKSIDFFKKRGFNSCIKIVEDIDESAVEDLVTKGDISYSDLEGITKTSVTYALDLKEKEVVTEEVSKSTFTSSAASRKPKLFSKRSVHNGN